MLDLAADAGALTAALVDVESVSGNEARLADLVEAALRNLPALAVERDGNVVLARTDLGPRERVVLAGHLDTVPIAGNLPSRLRRGRAARLRHHGHEVRAGGDAADRRTWSAPGRSNRAST